jgi:flagellar basal body-associated protein FliL
MRQLKGKVKETRERKQENLKNKEKLWTIVIPVMVTISVVIAAYVLLSTHSL